jgi:ABC-2 type transport system permease protein
MFGATFTYTSMNLYGFLLHCACPDLFFLRQDYHISKCSSYFWTNPYRLFMDMQRGIFERFHSMPIARSAPLWGHVLTSLVSNAISVVVIILVALVMGFRSSAGVLSWFAVAGILALFTLALTWIAVIAGLSATSVDGAGAFAYPLIFLPFISSAFVPTESMPKLVRAFAENQPVTSIVDAIRALLSGQPVGNDIWIALAWCVGIMLVAYVFAMMVYKKRV